MWCFDDDNDEDDDVEICVNNGNFELVTQEFNPVENSMPFIMVHALHMAYIATGSFFLVSVPFHNGVDFHLSINLYKMKTKEQSTKKCAYSMCKFTRIFFYLFSR